MKSLYQNQLKSDPGLIYDRIHWRIKKRKYDSALNLLLEINNTDSSKLVRPDKFWAKKNFLIRKLIDKHEYNTAYKLSINHGLKENKYMLINISNTPKHKFIENETIRISQQLGFVQEETLKLTLSSINGKGYKYEPIFVFRKESK